MDTFGESYLHKKKKILCLISHIGANLGHNINKL